MVHVKKIVVNKFPKSMYWVCNPKRTIRVILKKALL